MNNSLFITENGLPGGIVDAARQYMPLFASSSIPSELMDAAVHIAVALGAQSSFEPLVQPLSADRDQKEEKMIDSFSRNVRLLVDKTWVEKSDEILKEQLLTRLGDFCNAVSTKEYFNAVDKFFPVLNDTVYLLFGQQTVSEDFLEYAVRIDPEFGLFWLYACQLKDGFTNWDSEKCRLMLFLGMCFLANF